MYLGNIPGNYVVQYGIYNLSTSAATSAMFVATTSTLQINLSSGAPTGQYADFDNVIVTDITELVTNGTFEGMTTGWTTTAGVATSNQQLQVTATADFRENANQNIPVAVGKTYKVSVTHNKGTASYSRIQLTGASGTVNPPTNTSATPVTYTTTFVATSSTLNIALYGSAGTSFYDNVSVKEVYNAGGYTNNVATLVKYIVTTYGTSANRLSGTDLDTAVLNAFEAANTQPVGIYMTDKTNVLEVVNNLATSVGARVAMSRLGLLYIVKLDLASLSAGTTVTPSMIANKSISVSQLPPVVAAVQIGYCKNWTVQTALTTGLPAEHLALYGEEWLTTTVTDAIIADLYRIHTEPTISESYLLTEATATAEATRRLNMFKVQRKVIKYTGFSDLMLEKLGNGQTIQNSRFGLSAGVTGQVISLATDWLNYHVTVEVLL
jgi:hypothetical protein